MRPVFPFFSGRFAKEWFPAALFGVLWVDLARQLSFHWESSEQYAYGWFVPFLAIGLFVRRWHTRPALTSRRAAVSQPSSNPVWLTVTTLLVCFFLLPVRVVHEINADWPACSWLLTLGVVWISLAAVFQIGGWEWVKHFAFPVCFILVAVAWPFRIEHALTQDLMRVVANLTVEVIGWFGVPAFQRGNLIEVTTGIVGIDEACSGIRSFQSTLMAGLFLGEFWRLSLPRRLLLLIGGSVMAFCFNVARTLFLTWKASSEGIESIHRWHDPAGLMIFFATFAGLFVLARLLMRSIPSPTPEIPSLTPPMPRRFFLAVGCWAVVMFCATETWYRSHEIEAPGEFHWSVRFPTNNPAYKPIELSASLRGKIGNDLGGSGMWTDDRGVLWNLHFFRWNPTSIQAVLRARIHRPEQCLPASGLREIASPGLVRFEVEGLQLPFQQYTFEAGGKTLQVFFCQWEDGAEKQQGMWGSKLGDRIRSVLVGRKKLGQQTLEIALAGPSTLEAAAALVRKALPELIQLEPAHYAQLSDVKQQSSHN